MQQVRQFWKDESGQDLIEYTLLMAFIGLVAVGIFAKAGTSTSTVWTSANTVLHNAAIAAS
jgi:Flp pilus assembly pilin Flp